MKKIIMFFCIIAISFIQKDIALCNDYGIMHDRLAYLQEIEEIEWIRYDKNSVYIGFSTLPGDYKTIINSAAIHGNRVLDFGVHVWAVPATEIGWRDGGHGKSYCNATARKGKLTRRCE